jgi:putative copper export protein
VLTAAAMTGEWSGLVDGGLIRMIWQAGAWREMAVRAAGLLLAAPAALADRRPTPPALVGAMAAASSFAWVGHAHALAASWPTAVAVIHLLGVAFWVGALVPLLLLLRHDDPRRAAAPVARFGNAALVGVGVLALAGLALLTALLGKFAYWQSPYGGGVALKLALVAALLACAAWNKLRLTRRLAANDHGALRRLRWSIRTELALAALILIVTASFTTLTGPPSLE